MIIDLIYDFVFAFWRLVSVMAAPLLFGYLAAGIVYQFFSTQMITKFMGGTRLYQSVKASLIGIPLPLCSCSVLPVAETLRKNGAGKGAVTSFVISTPQTGIDSIVVTYSALGLAFALFKAIAAFVSGVIGGILVDIFDSPFSQKNIQDEKIASEKDQCSCECSWETEKKRLSVFAKIAGALKYALINLPEETTVHLLFGFLVKELKYEN